MDPNRLSDYFDPSYFLVKLTPVNPTTTGPENQLAITEDKSEIEVILKRKSLEFEREGFWVIQSVGDMEENFFGSNCGQTVRQIKTVT